MSLESFYSVVLVTLTEQVLLLGINHLLCSHGRYHATVSSHEWIVLKHSMHSTHRTTFQTHRRCFRNGLRGKKTKRQPKYSTTGITLQTFMQRVSMLRSNS